MNRIEFRPLRRPLQIPIVVDQLSQGSRQVNYVMFIAIESGAVVLRLALVLEVLKHASFIIHPHASSPHSRRRRIRD